MGCRACLWRWLLISVPLKHILKGGYDTSLYSPRMLLFRIKVTSLKLIHFGKQVR